MTRWISEDRVIELERMGRLRDNVTKAAEWNGNVEPVKTTSGGLRPRESRSAAQTVGDSPSGLRPVPAAAHLYPLVNLCRMARIAEPVPEFKFHHSRKWRFDYAFPLHMLAVEIEGGLWTNGRHSRGKGAIADIEKYSEAAIMGWRILYATPQELDNGIALDRVVRALTDRAAA